MSESDTTTRTRSQSCRTAGPSLSYERLAEDPLTVTVQLPARRAANGSNGDYGDFGLLTAFFIGIELLGIMGACVHLPRICDRESSML